LDLIVSRRKKRTLEKEHTLRANCDYLRDIDESMLCDDDDSNNADSFFDRDVYLICGECE
jgi:hypothetical protein